MASTASQRGLAREFPLRIQDRVEVRVAPVLLVPLVLPQESLADHADLLEDAKGRRVGRVALGPDAMKPAPAESEFDDGRGRFRREPPAPERRMKDVAH